jgi:AraC-like DNA-binding protein
MLHCLDHHMDHRIDIVLATIAKQECRPNVTRLASSVGLSASRFQHLFKQSTGIPFQRHWERVRLRRACELLADPALRVSEIAYKCGFNHVSSFDHFFRAKCGVPPGEYRRSRVVSGVRGTG